MYLLPLQRKLRPVQIQCIGRTNRKSLLGVYEIVNRVPQYVPFLAKDLAPYYWQIPSYFSSFFCCIYEHGTSFQNSNFYLRDLFRTLSNIYDGDF